MGGAEPRGAESSSEMGGLSDGADGADERMRVDLAAVDGVRVEDRVGEDDAEMLEGLDMLWRVVGDLGLGAKSNYGGDLKRKGRGGWVVW